MMNNLQKDGSRYQRKVYDQPIKRNKIFGKSVGEDYKMYASGVGRDPSH
jgi:hypothetical protein